MAKSRTEPKRYIGQRPADDDVGDCKVVVITASGHSYLLPHMVHHSPNGFEWGYLGSGASDLALSILQDHFGESKVVTIFRGKVGRRAWELHQRFKFQMLQELGHYAWCLTTDHIETWLALQPAGV